MNTLTLDGTALNGLFENQKKLDDLFDAIFDGDNFFISSSPAPMQSVHRNPEIKVRRQSSHLSANLSKRQYSQKNTVRWFSCCPLS
ncbi:MULTISPECIES: hypothetical protein [Methylomonas]|uniref:Uncharacterized protein n=2 Tax=Methylomonas TaxID=416 RepID=A0A126T478_9GAMM|nr:MULTISPECIES: hypothetical protein [Methylomonas]AMK76886.1 hypothetical protein JT25_010365 [Methylomonas denitrificans]OAI09146.1 hypothetical protein A1342_19815 [Methylomonas methanica]TCV74191.1 hypothetical protein EDE11_1395 [Methylomonas methanica]